MKVDRTGRAGFTVLELLVASSVSVLLVFGVTVLFLSQARAYHDVKLQHELQEDLRFCLDTVCRDLRHAGYGLPANRTRADGWITWSSNITNAVAIEAPTGGGPQTIHVFGALEAPVSTLSAATSNGATVIQVASGTGPLFDEIENRVLYLGKSETVRVVSRLGDLLTISAHPAYNAIGLSYAHPAGALIEPVASVTYRCRAVSGIFSNASVLVREPYGADTSTGWLHMVSENIESLSVVPSSYWFNVSIRGRTAAELFYPSAAETDAFVRLSLDTRVLPRNTPPLRTTQQ